MLFPGIYFFAKIKNAPIMGIVYCYSLGYLCTGKYMPVSAIDIIYRVYKKNLNRFEIY